MILKQPLAFVLLFLLFVSTGIAQTLRTQEAAATVSPEETEAQKVFAEKSVALIREALPEIKSLRLVDNRVRAQARAGALLWKHDEKLARTIFEEAATGMSEYLKGLDREDQNYNRQYNTAMQLRNEMLEAFAPHDPELALRFLRATRLPSPNYDRRYPQVNMDAALESRLASLVALNDPQKALQIARESLAKGFPTGLADVLSQIQVKDREAAEKLAGEVTAKLQSENLLKNAEATSLALNLLYRNKPASDATANPQMSPLLSEQAYRDLLLKTLNAGLGYTSTDNYSYSIERNNAQNILNSLQSMLPQIEKYATAQAAELRKSAARMSGPSGPQGRMRQQYQEIVNSGTVDAALEKARQAPPELRDSLYQQIAWKALNAGDIERARQIINDNISNPAQRNQMLQSLAQQGANRAASQSKIDEARMLIAQIRTPRERATALVQLAMQLTSQGKKEAATTLLEEVRAMFPARAEDQQQIYFLMEIARAYAALNPAQSFAIIEPVADQFNELSNAAQVLNGFGQQFFKDGELMMQYGNVLSSVVSQLSYTLPSLARTDFERTKAAIDKLQRPEARVTLYLSVAQAALGGPIIRPGRVPAMMTRGRGFVQP